MQGFSSRKLKVESEDGRNFTLLEAFSYTAKDGTVYTVHAGSESDGASTPPILWEKFNVAWIPPFGWYWRAAFLHDWLYRYSQYPKEQCDGLFLEAMEWIIDQKKEGWFITEAEERLKAGIIYDGVSVGGWSAFDEDRTNKV